MNPEAIITVVSGLPRSGTSLLMQMLHAGGMPVLTDHLRPGDESNPKGYFEYEPVKRLARAHDWLRLAEGHAVKIIAQLLTHLPEGFEYRVIMLRRDIDEVLESQRRMLERLHGSAPAGDSRLLAETFQTQWRQAVEVMRDRPRTHLLIVDHRALIDAPARTAAEMAAFLSHHPLDTDAMSACVDPTLHRVRRST